MQCQIMQIKIKKTFEICETDWDSYIKLFNLIFHQNYTVAQMKYKYTNTPWGYSLHSLLYIDGVLVGAQSAIPEKLSYQGQEILLACTCDTFIKKECRVEIDTLAKMFNLLLDALQKDGVVGIIGETYQKLHNYLCVMCHLKLIGNVCNWVLPVSVLPGILGIIFNPILRLGIRTALTIAQFSRKPLFRGNEKFKAWEYYTPCMYFTKEFVCANGCRCNYHISTKKHLMIEHDNFQTQHDLVSGIKELLNSLHYKVKAVEYRTGCHLPVPFICYRKGLIFNGKLLSDKVPEEDFYSMDNWQYKRGYFD